MLKQNREKGRQQELPPLNCLPFPPDGRLFPLKKRSVAFPEDQPLMIAEKRYFPDSASDTSQKDLRTTQKPVPFRLCS